MKTIKVSIKSKDLEVSTKVKTYYYKNCDGKEVIIGGQKAMDTFHLGKSADECHIEVYSKWTRKRKSKIHTFIVNNINKNIPAGVFVG